MAPSPLHSINTLYYLCASVPPLVACKGSAVLSTQPCTVCHFAFLCESWLLSRLTHCALQNANPLSHLQRCHTGTRQSLQSPRSTVPIQTEGVCAPCDSGVKCSFTFILYIYYNILIILFYMYNCNMGKKYIFLILYFIITFYYSIIHFYVHKKMGKKKTKSLIQFLNYILQIYIDMCLILSDKTFRGKLLV